MAVITRSHGRRTPARQVVLQGTLIAGTGASQTGKPIGVVPFRTQRKGLTGFDFRVVDVILSTLVAGAGNTTSTFTVKKQPGSQSGGGSSADICSTDGVLAGPSSGTPGAVGDAIDAKGQLTAPAGTGVTRPVLKTDSTVLCREGDSFVFDLALGGTVTTGPVLAVAVVLEAVGTDG